MPLQLEINNETRIADLQWKFNSEFPFLKIEFLRKQSLELRKSVMSEHLLIGEFQRLKHTGIFLVNSSMTVSQLESTFSHLFGLSVQVLRKSGKLWLETSLTESWTLEQQNLLGEELSKNNGNALSA